MQTKSKAEVEREKQGDIVRVCNSRSRTDGLVCTMHYATTGPVYGTILVTLDVLRYRKRSIAYCIVLRRLMIRYVVRPIDFIIPFHFHAGVRVRKSFQS